MSAALSKALTVHNPNWLAERLGTESYVRKLGNVLYAVIVAPDRQLQAVYVVTPRQMRVRRTSSWPSGVVDPHHVRDDYPLVRPDRSRMAPPLTISSSVFEKISEGCQRTYALLEEISSLRTAHSRACAVARESLGAADAALAQSATVLVGCDRPHLLSTVRTGSDARRGLT